MALTKNKKGIWIWDFYPDGSKGKRIRKPLPSEIETREEAEMFIAELKHTFHLNNNHVANFDIKNWSKKSNRNTIEPFFIEGYAFFKNNLPENQYKEIVQNGQNILRYLIENKVPQGECINPTPNLVSNYIQFRERLISPKRINKELFTYKRLHDYWASQGYSIPLNFEMHKFYVKDPTEKTNFSEKFFELLIESFPAIFLEEELEFIAKSPILEKLIPDSLFAAKDGTYVVVEIQKNRLDRQHAYKILEYRDKLELKLKRANTDARVRMLEVVIGENCSHERRHFLEKYGIELKMIPISIIEEKILSLVLNNK